MSINRSSKEFLYKSEWYNLVLCTARCLIFMKLSPVGCIRSRQYQHELNARVFISKREYGRVRLRTEYNNKTLLVFSSATVSRSHIPLSLCRGYFHWNEIRIHVKCYLDDYVAIALRNVEESHGEE